MVDIEPLKPKDRERELWNQTHKLFETAKKKSFKKCNSELTNFALNMFGLIKLKCYILTKSDLSYKIISELKYS